MKKFQSAIVTIQSTPTKPTKPISKTNSLIELLPQIAKIFPQIKSIFNFENPNLPQNTTAQQPVFSQNFKKSQNKKVAIQSIENHKKLVNQIKQGHP